VRVPSYIRSNVVTSLFIALGTESLDKFAPQIDIVILSFIITLYTFYKLPNPFYNTSNNITTYTIKHIVVFSSNLGRTTRLHVSKPSNLLLSI
jgi:hypothetical protein